MLGKIPASRLYGLGLNILNIYPVQANTAQTPGLSYNYQFLTPVVNSLTSQPAFRLDYQISQKMRLSGKGQFQIGNSDVVPGIIPGFNDTRNPVPYIYAWAIDGELPGQPDDVLRRHVRLLAEPAWGAGRDAVLQQEQHRARRDSDAVSGFRKVRSVVLRGRDSEQIRRAIFRRWRVPIAADLCVGPQPQRAEHAAEPRLSELPEHQPDPGRGPELDQGLGAPHDEGRLLQPAQLQGREHQHRPGAVDAGRHQLRARHEQPARHRRGLRQRRARHLQHVRATEHPGRRHLRAQHVRGVPAGQLEGEPEADA